MVFLRPFNTSQETVFGQAVYKVGKHMNKHDQVDSGVPLPAGPPLLSHLENRLVTFYS